MYQFIALYNQPEDPAAFDKHYDGVHAPLANKLPGLQRYTVSRPGPDADGNPPAYYMIAVLDFASEESFGAAVTSAEAQEAIADLANFTGAGVTLLNGPAGIA